MRIVIYLLIFNFGFNTFCQSIKKDILLPDLTIVNNFKIDSITKELNYPSESSIFFYLNFKVDQKGDLLDFKIRGENEKLSKEVTKYFFNNYKEIIDKYSILDKNKYTIRVIIKKLE